MFNKKIKCRDTNEFVIGYKDYLLTNHWKLKRIEVANREKYTCEICGEYIPFGFNIHHKSYKRLGNEKSNDLMFLCEKCHTELHISLRAKKNNLKKKNNDRKCCYNCYYSQIMKFKGSKDRFVFWCNKKCTTCDGNVCSSYRKGEMKEIPKKPKKIKKKNKKSY